MNHYIDANGAVGMGNPHTNLNDKEYTEAVNSSKMAEAAKLQNELYAKELVHNKAFNIWTICITALGTLVSIASLIISLCK